MLENRKLRMVGLAVLISIAFIVTFSAFNPPARANDEAVIPVTGNQAGLAQYHRSEWGVSGVNQNGLEQYYQSEHMQAYHAQNAAASPLSNGAGLAQYQRSERSARVANQKGLAIYHMSEWFGR